MNDITLKISEEGTKTLERMSLHTSRVSSVWGRHRPEMVTKQAQSHQQVLTRALGFGGTVSRDGDLSLLLQSGMTIGVVPHRQILADFAPDDLPSIGAYPEGTPMLGKVCWAHDSAGTYCLEPVMSGKLACEGKHDPMVFGTPIPVEWSMHS